MTTHDFATTLPLGICSTCLARMVDPKVGMPARTLALPDGRTILVYCEHNVAGPGAVGRGYGSAPSQNWRTNWRTVWRPHGDALASRRRLSCRLNG